MIDRKHVLQSDNLAFPEFETARAALEFFRNVENGTAIVTLPDRDGVMTEKTDGLGFYKALAGDVYVARIVAYTGNGIALIDVAVPGCDEPVRLSGIKVR